MINPMSIEQGLWVRPYSNQNSGHIAIDNKAICGKGAVRPARFTAHVRLCGSCENIAKVRNIDLNYVFGLENK